MAAFDWLTGDSPAQRQERRDKRAKQAAEAALRAQEHINWLRSLTPDQRRAYDLEQELAAAKDRAKKLEKKNEKLEDELYWEKIRRQEAERRAS